MTPSRDRPEFAAGRCVGCRHFDDNGHTRWGKCDKLSSWNKVANVEKDHEDVHAPFVVHEPSDFGCTLFEPREGATP